MTAARTGKDDVLKLLIARGADIRAHEPSKGQTALMWAAAENNAAAVKLLVEAGADLHERSRGGSFTPLLFAVRAGHIDASKALLDLGAKIEDALPDGTSALVLATINAHYELAGFLLEGAPTPTRRRRDGQHCIRSHGLDGTMPASIFPALWPRGTSTVWNSYASS